MHREGQVMNWLKRRKADRMWAKTAEFVTAMQAHGIDKIVIERHSPGDYADMVIYLDGKDDSEWVTNEFEDGTPIKKWLRKHFYML